MKRLYLEVTFRKGKPLAAYLYLPRPAGIKAVRTVEARPHVLVDYAGDGSAIGVELTAPSEVALAQVNDVLHELGLAGLAPEDLAPLRAA